MKILVVEDNKINQKIAQNILKNLVSEIQIAGTAAEAILMLQNQKFDVVLMDENLGGVTITLKSTIDSFDPQSDTGQYVVNYIRDREHDLEDHKKTIIISCTTESYLLGRCDEHGKYEKIVSYNEEEAKNAKEKGIICHAGANGRVDKELSSAKLRKIFSQFDVLKEKLAEDQERIAKQKSLSSVSLPNVSSHTTSSSIFTSHSESSLSSLKTTSSSLLSNSKLKKDGENTGNNSEVPKGTHKT